MTHRYRPRITTSEEANTTMPDMAPSHQMSPTRTAIADPAIKLTMTMIIN